MGRHIGKKVWLWKICIITLILVFVVLIKSLVFEVFAIPTGSMANTLLPGDVILVNKINCGPRLPRSPIEIPWVNFLFYKKAG
ncbi:MAG: S26 family signal peptidase, partial [Draconibacterium sp.]|nr:S26 family signal peptidase [Draconibacterium sp.]